MKQILTQLWPEGNIQLKLAVKLGNIVHIVLVHRHERCRKWSHGVGFHTRYKTVEARQCVAGSFKETLKGHYVKLPR